MGLVTSAGFSEPGIEDLAVVHHQDLTKQAGFCDGEQIHMMALARHTWVLEEPTAWIGITLFDPEAAFANVDNAVWVLFAGQNRQGPLDHMAVGFKHQVKAELIEQGYSVL